MISKLLIANRGEIAVRIAATCRRLGIRTVAIYSDADREALHVEACDEARYVGASAPGESYLVIDRVVEAAVASGAEAVHPGYGFLAENADFADRVRAAGLRFVGPTGDMIRAVGSKAAARQLAVAQGVPVVPGYDGVTDEAGLAREAEAIGFPLLIKATAGGGGRGIRLVESIDGFAGELALAKKEALGSFGDDTVLLERAVQRPRHVEVQIAGDGQGGAIHLLERECSIQRRHQKVVEEAPAPNLPREVREALHQHALTIATAVRYEGLGTVEFLYEAATGECYFLEVNPRLQVEHPVTEGVTGLDLVELQLRIASGEGLPITQDEVRESGSAIEVRLCAEVPSEDYRPATGPLTRFRAPRGLGVRVDTGFVEGSVVSPYYDSLLAKVICHGETREIARRRLVAALDEIEVGGVETNLDFLRDLAAHPGFATADLDTAFLTRHAPIARREDDTALPVDRIAAAAARVLWLQEALTAEAEAGPWKRLGAWRVIARSGKGSSVAVEMQEAGETTVVRVSGWQGHFEFSVDGGEALSARAWWAESGSLRLEFGGVLHKRNVSRGEGRIEVDGGGVHRRFEVRDRDEVAAKGGAANAGSVGDVEAHIPGRVESVAVEVGDVVAAGDVVCVLEAMKMVHELTAPGAGRIIALHCRPGDVVETGRILAEISSEAISEASVEGS